MIPNQDQSTTAAVTLVAAGLAYAAGHGWIDGDQVGALAAAIVTVGVAGWHMIRNTQLNKVAKAAAEVHISPAEQAKAGIVEPVFPPPPTSSP